MLFSTEQVSKYHPDKYADQISDAILVECLKQDKNSHCGIETMVKDNVVVLGGEITSNAIIDYEKIVEKVANKLGYKVEKIINLIGKQSQEINEAVVSDENIGAGDQGIMFGYATNENNEYLPQGFYLANRIIEFIENDIENNPNTILKGDAKTQVTLDLETKEIATILISVCHKNNYTLEEVKEYILNLTKPLNIEPSKFLINPAGIWNIGGPTSDCGLTGRKIVCDQYGGYCAVGGGAFSGKDPTKVDRSASYVARIIAVDLLKTFNLSEVNVELAYAIGVSAPISINIDFKISNTTPNNITNEIMKDYINKNYDLTPKGIINKLDLYNIDYAKLAEGNTMGKLIKLFNL